MQLSKVKTRLQSAPHYETFRLVGESKCQQRHSTADYRPAGALCRVVFDFAHTSFARQKATPADSLEGFRSIKKRF
jgi:hypothetical protein